MNKILLSILSNISDANYSDEEEHFIEHCRCMLSDDEDWQEAQTWDMVLSELENHCFGSCKVTEFLRDETISEYDYHENFKNWIKPYCEQVLKDILDDANQPVPDDEDDE